MVDHVQTLVVGAGVVGLAVARELALAGREVRAVIYHRTGSNGRTYVNVSEFKPSKTKPAKPAKVVAAADDIPF
jgi:glycine/D-amino acid oxidase-like deaminating enzyme